ncbi:MAG: hypothetical protein AB2693_21340 [Candidatus Thiodiazotropha sp.]
MGGKNENQRIVSPESLPIHHKSWEFQLKPPPPTPTPTPFIVKNMAKTLPKLAVDHYNQSYIATILFSKYQP